MNKRAAVGYMLNMFGFILIMIIIGGGIVSGVLVFFGKGYDFRQAESGVLLSRVESCFLNNDFFSEDFDMERDCSLNRKVLEKDHLVLVRSLEDEREYFIGVYDYQTQCDLKSTGGKFAKCAGSVLSKDGIDYEIIVGSNQDSRRVIG